VFSFPVFCECGAGRDQGKTKDLEERQMKTSQIMDRQRAGHLKIAPILEISIGIGRATGGTLGAILSKGKEFLGEKWAIEPKVYRKTLCEAAVRKVGKKKLPLRRGEGGPDDH